MGQVFQLLGELFDFLPLLADDDADAGGIDVDDDLLASPLDADARDAGATLLDALVDVLLDEVADPEVLDEEVRELLLAAASRA
jgi:hypothetical protein